MKLPVRSTAGVSYQGRGPVAVRDSGLNIAPGLGGASQIAALERPSCDTDRVLFDAIDLFALPLHDVVSQLRDDVTARPRARDRRQDTLKRDLRSASAQQEVADTAGQDGYQAACC
jgi:hypothetical protein